MRALQAFQRVTSSLGAAQTTTVAAAILGAGSCRLRGLATSTLAREQGKPEPAFPDALDQEFDRGEDPAMAAVHEREYEEHLKARQEMGTVCADLEYELDRDDPDAVDPKEVWAEAKAAECPEVDLDTEFDRDDPMMADKSHLWDAPEPPQPADVSGEMDLMADAEDVPAQQLWGEQPVGDRASSPGGTMAGNTAQFGGRGTSRRPPERPDPRLGQFRE